MLYLKHMDPSIIGGIQSQEPNLQTPHLSPSKKVFLALAFWLLISYVISWSLLTIILSLAIGYEPITFVKLLGLIFNGIISFPLTIFWALYAFGHPENIVGFQLLLSLPMVILVIIIGVVVFIASFLRKFIMITIPLVSLLLAVTSFVYFSILSPQVCNYWSCEIIEVLAYISSFLVVASISLVPFSYSLNSGTVDTTKFFLKSVLPGLISIFLVFAIWYLGAYLPAQSISKATDTAVTMRTKSKLNDAKTKTNFLEPTHIPDKFCGKVHEQYNEGKIETFYGCSADKVGDLEITQANLNTISSYLYAKNIADLKEDINKSRAISAYSSDTRISQWRWSTYENISVKGKPALYIYTNPEYAETISDYTKGLIFFTETSRVEIKAGRFSKQVSTSTTKEELVKLAESMTPAIPQ